jgi:hypothetical protein
MEEEEVGTVEDIHHALVVPPLVRVVDLQDVGVVGGPQEVQLRHVVGVAELLVDAPVVRGDAVRDVGVAVKVPEVQLVLLAADRPRVALRARPLGGHAVEIRLGILERLFRDRFRVGRRGGGIEGPEEDRRGRRSPSSPDGRRAS